ncbi:MAG: AAA family ATPase [Sulfuriferula sp.]
MRISKFQIANYKGYIDSGDLLFTPGFNIVVGQNNAGKTTLLNALNLNFTGKPHKSIETIPTATSPPNPNTSATVTLTVDSQELKNILLTSIAEIRIPLPSGAPDASKYATLLEDLLAKPEISFTIGLLAATSQPPSRQVTPFPSFANYECLGSAGARQYAWFRCKPDKSGFQYVGVTTTDENSEIGHIAFELLKQRIYWFSAERLSLGSCAVGLNRVLAPNAQNLPEVLHVLLTRNPRRFERFNKLLREIFPSIYEVWARSKQGNQLEIVVWTEDPATERDDLAIELSESGTGIGQVLAILYVAINSDFSRTIIIDEPNSFLHPGAARKLIEILKKNFSQHQYIIATHSPEIIKVAAPEMMTLVRWEKPKSVIEQLDAKQVTTAQRSLVEVGARLSDVFGADHILWVEGQTEEACFQLILDRLAYYPLLGLTIAAVRETGDFEGKRPSANMVWDIYTRLSSGNALIPSALAFVFDQEARDSKERDDLVRKSGGRLHFLPRRMYENYLLDTDAIFSVMSDLPTFQQEGITEEQVRAWLMANGGKKEYLADPIVQANLADTNWLQQVDGARLLKRLFEGISGNREEYRKTIHSVQLTDWLITNKPEQLAELKDFLIELLPPQPA